MSSELIADTNTTITSYIRKGILLIGALAWNDFITSYIREIYHVDNSNIYFKFMYAFVMTIIIVVILKIF